MLSLTALSCPVLPDISPAFSSEWTIPIRTIKRFGAGSCSKVQKKRGGVYCLQKPLPKEETLVGLSENAATVQVPFSSKGSGESYSVVGQPSIPSFLRFPSLGAADQAFIVLSFIACTTTVAFVSLIVTTIPLLNAMRRAALSLEKLADTAREELPGTMAAVRLSGMEISDLTVEMSDLSQEISDGVRKSAQAVQAAEVGIRRMGALASSKAISMIEERANLPIVTIKPVVASAAETTSDVVQRARRALMRIIKSRLSSMPDADRSEM